MRDNLGYRVLHFWGTSLDEWVSRRSIARAPQQVVDNLQESTSLERGLEEHKIAPLDLVFDLLTSDYDAPVDGGFHHWIVYNIPASARQLVGNNAFTEGTNSFGFTGYGGPCPPRTGETHHYLFLLYATDLAQIGGPGLTFDDVIKALSGHVLRATSIIGTFHLPQ